MEYQDNTADFQSRDADISSRATGRISRFRQLINMLLVHRSDAIIVQLFRFASVGALATIVDFSIFNTLVKHIHINFLIANIFSFSAGTVVSYIFSIRWVFTSRNLTNRHLEFTMFLLIGLIGLGLTELILWTVVSLLGYYHSDLHFAINLTQNVRFIVTSPIFAKIVAIFLVFGWNFGARKRFMFRNKG
jgi:putative flippase GtrA